jgi:predicted secreted protein
MIGLRVIAYALLIVASWQPQSGAGAVASGMAVLSSVERHSMAGDVVVVLGDTPADCEITIGERLQVRLPAQLGAGFSWSIGGSLPAALRLVNEKTERSSSAQLEGGIDIQVFTFEAVALGEGQLTFIYRRPFLQDEPPRKSVAHTVVVRPA